MHVPELYFILFSHRNNQLGPLSLQELDNMLNSGRACLSLA